MREVSKSTFFPGNIFTAMCTGVIEYRAYYVDRFCLGTFYRMHCYCRLSGIGSAVTSTNFQDATGTLWSNNSTYTLTGSPRNESHVNLQFKGSNFANVPGAPAIYVYSNTARVGLYSNILIIWNEFVYMSFNILQNSMTYSVPSKYVLCKGKKSSVKVKACNVARAKLRGQVVSP